MYRPALPLPSISSGRHVARNAGIPVYVVLGTEGLIANTCQLTVSSQPFRPQNPVNPSWEITRLLPPFLPPPAKGHTASELSVLAVQPPVRILIYPEPVKVAYKTVRPLVPKLWEGRKIDYMVHIGMASGRKYYSVERRGHRDGYVMKDVDDELLGDEEKREEGKHWAWEGMPEEILSDTNIDEIWRRWRTALPVFLSPTSTVVLFWRLTRDRVPIFGCLKMLAGTCATLYITRAFRTFYRRGRRSEWCSYMYRLKSTKLP